MSGVPVLSSPKWRCAAILHGTSSTRVQSDSRSSEQRNRRAARLGAGARRRRHSALVQSTWAQDPGHPSAALCDPARAGRCRSRPTRRTTPIVTTTLGSPVAPTQPRGLPAGRAVARRSTPCRPPADRARRIGGPAVGPAAAGANRARRSRRWPYNRSSWPAAPNRAATARTRPAAPPRVLMVAYLKIEDPEKMTFEGPELIARIGTEVVLAADVMYEVNKTMERFLTENANKGIPPEMIARAG